MSEVVIGPWPAGIDNVSPRTQLSSDERGKRITVLDAINVDFDRAGAASRRAGRTKVSSTSAHSVRGDLCMVGANLSRFSVAGDVATYATLISMGSDHPVSYCDLNAHVVASNLGRIAVVSSAGAFELGVAEPAAVTIAAASNGGLSAGRYGVVVTHYSTEESGASALYTVDVSEGGGIRLSGLAHSIPLRVYRTSHNGDVLYQCADIPVGMATFLVGAGKLGRECTTRHLQRTPPGHIVREYGARLWIARGRIIYFTEAMRFGLYDPRHNFIQHAKRITMIAPVASGIFVGDADGVTFYRGDTPGQMVPEDTSSEPPVPGTDADVSGALLSGDLRSGRRNAIWLTARGFVIGTADGNVVEPQASRIRLQAVAGGIAVNDRRITAIVKEE